MTVRVKNTTLHLNGQNLRLAAKNGCNSKTPGLHLSVKHEKEAVFPTTQASVTQLLLKSSLHDRDAESQLVRRPLKLSPLELPEEVRKAQKQKLKFVQQDVKPAEPQTGKMKSCVRQGPGTSAGCPSAYAEPPQAQQQHNRFPRPQLSRCHPAEKHADGRLKEVVCRGTSAPLCRKPAPLVLSPRVKHQLGCDGEAALPNPGPPRQDARRRRPRLSRARRLEDDLNASTAEGGDADKGEGQRVERNPRRRTKAGEGFTEAPAGV